MRAVWLTAAFLLPAIVIAAVPGRAQVAGYIFAPLSAICVWRFWNLGVHVEDNGVLVVSPILSRRVPWAEIDCFEVRPWLQYPYPGYVVLQGDRAPIPIMAIGAGRPENERHRLQAQEPIDRLNEALAEWRRSGEVSEPGSPGRPQCTSASPSRRLQPSPGGDRAAE